MVTSGLKNATQEKTLRNEHDCGATKYRKLTAGRMELVTAGGCGPHSKPQARRKMVNIGRKHFSGLFYSTFPKNWIQLEGWLVTGVGRWWVLPGSREQL